MAHEKPEQLKILLSLLDDEENDIFIHLDKKSDICAETLINKENTARLYFTECTKTTWGGIL